jgi:hypothetical protein
MSPARARLFVSFSVLFGACVSDPASQTMKMTGEEGGPCFMDATCKTGLVCVVPNMCVKPDGGTSNEAGLDSQTGMDGTTNDSATTDGDAAKPCLGGTIAHWSFEGNATPAIGNVALMAMGVTYPTGHVGKGAKLNPGYFTTTTQAFGGLNEITIEFWLRSDTSGMSQRLFYYAETNGVLWTSYTNPNPYTIDFSIGAAYVSGPAIPNTAWHHIALVYGGGQAAIYFDGISNWSGNGTGMIPSGNANVLSVGADLGGTNVLSGMIDELAIYNKRLSAQQINDIFSAGSAGYCRMQ